MQAIIDVPANIGDFARDLADAGVKTAIRYYNHHNSSRLPSKCLTASELQALHEAGMSVAVVFEQRAGAPGSRTDRSHIEDFGAENGRSDARRALELADQVRQPNGSAIYFGVDFDFASPSDLDQITAYFEAAKSEITGQYRLGCYGSGLVGRHLQSRRLVDHMWLAGATGWSGFEDALRSNTWSLFQRDLNKHSDVGNFIMTAM